MQKDSKRLFILSRSEIQKLYDFPIFNIAEQHEYFTMNAQERKMAFSHHKLSAKIYFILQLGYFKAKKSFFTLTDTKIASIHDNVCPALIEIGNLSKKAPVNINNK